jgi:hypothetical protein
LDELGESFAITRERVRQVLSRAVRKIKAQIKNKTGTSLFDEDYYVYFFETYAFDRADGANWLGITEEIRNYMDLMGYKKGACCPLEEALKDTQKLDSGLRLKIKNYLNRGNIYIDGKWIKKSRTMLESVVIKKCCKDELTFTEFTDIFNSFLEKVEIPYDEGLYYTESVLASRKNRFTEARDILWKTGELFRYYDIDGQDYTELIETLNLGFYHDIELSTAKFMMEYPNLMKKYDIRDEYELHNLLKKVLEKDDYGKFEDLQFGKMPMLRFSTPDRNKTLLELMLTNAPVSSKDLHELIHSEYGYDWRQIPAYLSHLSEYLHQGVYSVGHMEMSEERMTKFTSALNGNFYTFEELKNIYCGMFHEADKNEVNSFNLKRMGFVVNSNYVVKNYPSAYKYFVECLTEKDTFHIATLRERFGSYGTYQVAFGDLKKNLEIIEYLPDQFINFRKLEKGGLTREMVSDFCDMIYETVEDCEFFTVHSLRRNGFASELFEFGFDDFFYGSLLASDERFSFRRFWRNVILRKDGGEISVKQLITDIVKRERRIDLYDLESILKEEYGCSNFTPADLVYKTTGAEVFYDTELQIFYADEELYYREIDEAGGFYR